MTTRRVASIPSGFRMTTKKTVLVMAIAFVLLDDGKGVDDLPSLTRV